MEGSSFEQLLAEIQGLTLRLKGGGGPGYFRKIEQMARVYMERLGQSDARHMNDAELREAFSRLPPAQGQPLAAIIERCREGAAHEGQRLAFTPADLIAELGALVTQSDESRAH